MRPQSGVAWFGISFLLHGATFFLYSGKPRSRPEPIVIAVESLPNSIASFKSPGKSVGKSNGKSKEKKGKAGEAPSLSMRDLLPHAQDFAGIGRKTRSGGLGGEGSQLGSDDGTGLGGGWITSVGSDQFMEVMPFVERVWKHIDDEFRYPKEFSFQQIEGRVHVRAIFNPDGTLDGDFKRIDSDSSYLETYVLAYLISRLEQAYIPRAAQPKNKMAMNLTFEFKIEYDRVLDERKGEGTLPHALLFRRVNIEKSVIEKKLDELFTRYLPPILIIPPMVYVDLFTLKTYIENFHKPSVDKTAEERLHQVTEKFKMVLRKTKSASAVKPQGK